MVPVSIAAIGWSISAVGWVISPIISKLINRCCSYLGFDASKKLEELGPKVLLLERVMEVVDESPYKDCLEKLCKDLKSALYEAEDILDDIEYHRLERMVRDDKLKSGESSSGSKKNSLISFMTTKDQESGMSKSQLKNSFEKIERVINDACKILEQLNLTSIANSDGGQVSAANSQTAVTTADPPLKVIGRDEERDKIITMLHEEDCNGQQNSNSDVCYSVIGIHGVAGSGKSTLAQYICAREKKDKEEKKDGHFDLVIWIHVSQKFDLEAIFRDMLEGATGKACPQFNSRSSLVENLKDELRGKRILLVLDDVWYNIRSEGRHQPDRELEELLSPMMVGMTGSKVLVTSRTKDALLALGAVEERCVPISELPDEVFLQMFMHYAFRGVRVDGHDRIKLELIGAKIAEKLNRSPLAARTVGSQLNLPSVANFDWRQVFAVNSQSAVTTADPPLKVIGRDVERDKIIAMLHEEDCNGQQNSNSDVCYSVIGIHGVAGSGKSTFAQHICAREKKDKEEKKDGHFELVIWIHVSQKFDLDAIFRDMLEGATGKACPQFSSRSTLVENLKKELREKRILLVLDDVWYNKWNGRHQLAELEQVLSPLMVGMAGSKVLVTSRTKDALLALGAVEERCVPISELPHEVFLQMFMHYAFRGVRVDGHDRTKLELLGAEIAEKLNRSPLAARTVGSQLRLRPNVAFWRMTRDQDLLKETKGALWWSYRHLDEQVRRCFAYCSIFPRRYRLERDKLVRLWVAEGFIKATNDEVELDAIGKGYFDELVSASFLQLGGKHSNMFQDGVVDYFTVHDLLRDLAEEVAGSDCFRIEEGRMEDVPQDVRHLFIGTREIPMGKIFELQNLRTLIIGYVPRRQMIEKEVFEVMFKKLLKLRVLSLDFRFTEDLKFSVPESIGQLKHLRYLLLKVSPLTNLVLPRSLTNLYHIQLLDFGGCSRLAFSSGEDMNQLINLRRVISFADLEFPNVGKLTWLQELPFFTVKNERGYELRQLKNLNKLQGKLQIHGLENVGSKDEAIEASLADKEQLAEVVLCWDHGSCSPEVQAEVLEALCPSKYLETLEIRHYNGLTYPNWMVGKQEGGPQHLQELELDSIRLVPPPQLFEFFVHLRSLTFMSCDWEVLPDNMERLTNLKMLWITDLKNIRALPTLPLSLEEIKIELCNISLMASCKTIGDPNWEKIQHIPTKKIY